MWGLENYSREALTKTMDACMRAEDYEHCARIRDEFKRRAKRKKFDNTIFGKILCVIFYTFGVLLSICFLSWIITTIGNAINSVL